MMYKDKLVLAVKVNGKILREVKDQVYIPFGSEYSLYFKNLESRRASVKVEIDGQDVLNGSSLIVNANDSINLERFLENNDRGNKFKFIERTGRIEQKRGVGAEDGIIRVEFQFEKKPPKVEYEDVYHYKRHHYWDDYYRPYYGPFYRSFLSNTSYGSTGAGGTGGGGRGSSMGGMGGGEVRCFAANVSTPTFDSFQNDAGITVKGGESNQKFQTVYGFNAESETHVMVLKLVGDVGQVKVTKPVTVRATRKIECDTCGTKNKPNASFCSHCGASLKIFA